MNIKYYATCESCNFKAISKNKWDIHLTSQKHQRNGKSKSEFNFCNICNYWCLYKHHLDIHKIVCHGTIEQKKTATFYCECCNKAFYCKMFYDKHNNSNNHKKMSQREQLIKNNVFKDVDNILIEKNYITYINDLKTKIETSLLITRINDRVTVKKNNYNVQNNL